MASSPISNTTDKRVLRKEILAHRQTLSSGEVEHRTCRIFKTFSEGLARLLPENYDSVAMYYPIRGEVDTRSFFKFFTARKKACLFPLTEKTGNGNSLLFYEIRDWSELWIGAMGIGVPRPRPDARPVRPDILLVPGIAFSEDAQRIGFGAGQYDRTASLWEQAGVRKDMRMIGLAYDFQLVPKIAHETHDHALDFVVTEEKILQKAAVP